MSISDFYTCNTMFKIELYKAICLLSRHPFFETFEIFLKFLYQMTVSNSIQHLSIEEHVSRFMNLPFPSRILKLKTEGTSSPESGHFQNLKRPQDVLVSRHFYRLIIQFICRYHDIALYHLVALHLLCCFTILGPKKSYLYFITS